MAETAEKTASPEASTKKTKTDGRKRTMTPEHKEALARGRQQGQAVRAYLEAIESTKPKRGRRVTTETLQERLQGIVERLGKEDLDPATRVVLVQEKLSIEAKLSATESESMLEELEKAFIENALPWSEQKGVTYAAFRTIGVEPRVLKAAGLEQQKAS